MSNHVRPSSTVYRSSIVYQPFIHRLSIVMQRFYIDIPTPPTLVLRESDLYHQLTRVLRARLGDTFCLFSGKGYDSEYRITAIDKTSITCDFVAKHENKSDPRACITLYQATPNKIEKIEWILQKGVEIGIRNFTFFPSERSQKLVLSPNKIARFQTIAREALEQCG
jgi:16S rRNA (uracil1498-N3)-methyltransferase